jgi:hypothetical protein
VCIIGRGTRDDSIAVPLTETDEDVVAGRDGKCGVHKLTISGRNPQDLGEAELAEGGNEHFLERCAVSSKV